MAEADRSGGVPYGMIWRALKKGSVVPFLGAGASLTGRSSDAKDEDALERWEPGAEFLPLGGELADYLAKEAGLNVDETEEIHDLAKIASYYNVVGDREILDDQLGEVFKRDSPLGDLHRFLAAIEVEVPLLIITTNYDDLIERAFDKENKKYHLVVHQIDNLEMANTVYWWKPGEVKPVTKPANSLPLVPGDVEEPIIYKMHGSINRRDDARDTFLITEEDYVSFLSLMLAPGGTAVPANIDAYLRKSRFLFLGYGLRDWNLRVMLEKLKASIGARGDQASPASMRSRQRQSWAIQYRPSYLERRLWVSRDVEIFDVHIDDFVAGLQRRAGLDNQ